jgi:hypothetical protein
VQVGVWPALQPEGGLLRYGVLFSPREGCSGMGSGCLKCDPEAWSTKGSQKIRFGM